MRLAGFSASRSIWGFGLAALAACLYVGTVPLVKGFGGLLVLNSPDAASVQVAERFMVTTGSPVMPTAAGWTAADGSPRSFTWNGSGWAPGSYPSLPALYAAVDLALGFGALPWISPALGAIGVWLMYLLVRRWRGPGAGLAAAGLLAVLPAYWHASVQPFTPAIPFVASLLAAALGITSRRAAAWVGGGLALGLALAIRPHEAIWVVPLAAVLLLRRSSWKQLGLIAVGAALPLAGAAYLQLATYGSVLGSGYSATSAGDGGPFSFGVRAIAANTWNYLVNLHGYVLGLAAMATGVAARGELRRYLWALAVAALGWLAIYGSYVVHDSPGLAEPTIGNSQVRYMLPLLVLLVPLAASWLARLRWGVAAAAVAIAAVLGYGAVVAAPGDGTRQVRQTLQGYRLTQQLVLMLTDPETLVVAGRMDKVMVGLRPTVFAATTQLPSRLADGARAVMLGGQGVPPGVATGHRVDLPGGLVLQELVLEP